MGGTGEMGDLYGVGSFDRLLFGRPEGRRDVMIGDTASGDERAERTGWSEDPTGAREKIPGSAVLIFPLERLIRKRRAGGVNVRVYQVEPRADEEHGDQSQYRACAL